MIYTIIIDCIDNETQFKLTTKQKLVALEFLKENDHEGSGIMIRCETGDADEIYKMLKE